MVDGNAAAPGCIVFHADMAAEHDVVSGDHTVLNNAVVGNVRVSHEVALAADAGDSSVFFGTSIHRDAFAEDIAVADNDLGWRPLVRQVLRIRSDDASRKKPILATNRCVTHEGHSIFSAGASPDPHVGPNDAMMPDPNIFIEFGSGIDYGGVSDDGWHF